MKYAFLDIDVNNSRAAYDLCKEFVKATNLRYGLSTNVLDDLGGGEKKQLPAFFESDFDWSSKGRIQTAPPAAERIIVELYDDAAPLAVENFMALCTGEKGRCKNSANNLHYKGCPFHRIVKDFICQAGDFVMGNGNISFGA